MTDKKPIELAADAVGGAVKLADLLGVSIQALSNWKTRDSVPADRCPDIEAITGIRCELLRPDVNWTVLRKRPAVRPVAQQQQQPQRKKPSADYCDPTSSIDNTSK